MNELALVLIDHPDIALFLTVGLGFVVGRLRYRSIALGAVTGTLLVGVAVGAIVSTTGPDGATVHLTISGPVRTVFFLLFLFALGARLGPQFAAGLRGSGLQQAAFAATLAVVGFAVVIATASVLGYNPGLAAGLAGGGLTQSAIVGVSQNAIAGLPVPPATRACPCRRRRSRNGPIWSPSPTP